MIRAAGAALVLALMLGTAPSARADTVPYDPSKTLIQLGAALADDNGDVLVDLTLPDEVTAPFEVIIAGIAAEPTDSDVPSSVIAEVGDAVGGGTQELASGAAGWADGELAGALLPAVADPTISASAGGFRPNSDVRLSVRFSPAAAGRGSGTGSGNLPRTGSEIAATLLIGLVAVVVGAALVSLALGRRRRLDAS